MRPLTTVRGVLTGIALALAIIVAFVPGMGGAYETGSVAALALGTAWVLAGLAFLTGRWGYMLPALLMLLTSAVSPGFTLGSAAYALPYVGTVLRTAAGGLALPGAVIAILITIAVFAYGLIRPPKDDVLVRGAGGYQTPATTVNGCDPAKNATCA